MMVVPMMMKVMSTSSVGFQESYLTFDLHLGQLLPRLSQLTHSREITENPSYWGWGLRIEDWGVRIEDWGLKMMMAKARIVSWSQINHTLPVKENHRYCKIDQSHKAWNKSSGKGCSCSWNDFVEMNIATMARIGSCLVVCDDFELHPNHGILI